MTTKINILGQKFNKLTVISIAPNIPPKNGIGREYTAWWCRCDCGKTIRVRTSSLTSDGQISCGCHVIENGMAIKAGQKFNKLTTISYDAGHWNCLCECGDTTTVLTHRLISGNTQSCGCLKVEKAKINIQKALEISTKYDPAIASVRRRWQSYLYQDENCDLTFDQWFEISQQNCSYCGCAPFNEINCFVKKVGATQKRIDNGTIFCNGLDRIDSSMPHILGNVVASCIICNRAKLDRLLPDFLKYLDNLTINTIIPNPKLLTLPTKYAGSIKMAYLYYLENYGQMEIDLQTFYTYSQLPCFYCGVAWSNNVNIYRTDKRMSQTAKIAADFYYNGIDRIDSSLTHVIDNIVPCCRWCNFAKSDMSLADFHNWIRNVQSFRSALANSTLART